LPACLDNSFEYRAAFGNWCFMTIGVLDK